MLNLCFLRREGKGGEGEERRRGEQERRAGKERKRAEKESREGEKESRR